MSVTERTLPQMPDPAVAIAYLTEQGVAYAEHEAIRSKSRPWYRHPDNQASSSRAELRRFRRYMRKGRAYR